MTAIEKAETILEFVLSMNSEPQVAPGLPVEDVADIFDAANIDAPADLVGLYAWHNGIIYLNAFLYFLDVELAINTYVGFAAHKREVPEFKWREGLFPVLTTNGDIYHCIDLATGATYDIDIEGDGFLKTADNYHHYLDAIIIAFEEKLFRFNPNGGYIYADDDDWDAMEKRFEITTEYGAMYGLE
ncbi:MAG: hypothetical protein ACR2QR_08480 [Woeseiaceae bacterium]